MIDIQRTLCRATCTLAMLGAIAACGGSSSNSMPVAVAPPPPVVIQGVATPSSVAVVTATNAP
jgi:hypothetical protein